MPELTSTSTAAAVIPLRSNIVKTVDPEVSAPFTPPASCLDLTLATRSVTPAESDADVPEIGAISADEEDYVSADDDEDIEASSTSSSLEVLDDADASSANASSSLECSAIETDEEGPEATQTSSTSIHAAAPIGANQSSSSSSMSLPPPSASCSLPATAYCGTPVSPVMKFKPQVEFRMLSCE